MTLREEGNSADKGNSMILNHEQRQAILARIRELEDDVCRCELALKRRIVLEHRAELAARITRAEAEIAKLKEGL